MLETLTGKRRFRKGFFGKLILQVEVTAEFDTEICPGIGDIERREVTGYRDATIEDLTVHDNVKGE